MSDRDGRVEEENVEVVGSENKDGVAPSVPEDIKSLIDSEIERLRSSVRDAVQDALANVLGDLLEEKEEEERRNVETEAEGLPKCPKNLSWLRKMFEILPPDILRESKLWKYRNCVFAVREAEKDAEDGF